MWNLLGALLCAIAIGQATASREYSRLVKPDIGMVISTVGSQSLPGNVMDLIFELSPIPGIIIPESEGACEIQIHRGNIHGRNGDTITNKAWHVKFRAELTNLCRRYKQMETEFRRAHVMMEAYNAKVRRLTHQLAISQYTSRTRHRRGFWSGIREVFNLGSHDRQNQLAQKITRLRAADHVTYGKLNKMEMIVQATANHSIQLRHVITRQVQTITKMKATVTSMKVMLLKAQYQHSMWRIVAKQAQTMTEHTLLAGSVGGQLLLIQTRLLHDRYQGLADGIHGQLSSLLIGPDVLGKALRDFQAQLETRYRGTSLFRIQRTDPAYYYKHSEPTVIQHDGTWYVHVPINVFVREGQYEVYHLSNYNLPTQGELSNNRYTRCEGYQPYIAISTDQRHYVEITTEEYTNHCTTPHKPKCLANKVIRDYHQLTCTLAIIQGDVTAVKELCRFEYAVLKHKPVPFLVYLGSGRYFLMNYQHDPWQVICGEVPKGEVSRHIQLEFQLGCGCYISADGLESPRFLDATCAESPQITVKSNQYVNLVYASYVLKETVARLQANITDDSLDLPEQLELSIPDFQDHDNSDQDVVFDLKALIDTINKQEAPALSHLDEDVETVLAKSDEVTTNRSMTVIALVTGGLTLFILAILCIRGGQLGKAVAVISSMKGAQARSSVNCAELDWIFATQLVLIGIVVMFMLEKAVKWLYGTQLSQILCTNARQTMPDASTEVRLEINSLLHSLSFKIMDIHAPPNTLNVLGSMDKNGIRMESRCLGAEVQFDWGTVHIKHYAPSVEHTDSNLRLRCDLPISMVAYDVKASHLRRILNESHQLHLLLGTGQHVTRHHVGRDSEAQLLPENLALLYHGNVVHRRVCTNDEAAAHRSGITASNTVGRSHHDDPSQARQHVPAQYRQDECQPVNDDGIYIDEVALTAQRPSHLRVNDPLLGPDSDNLMPDD